MARKKPTGASHSPEANPTVDAGVTLDRLLGALPEQNDLAPLRQALLRASTADVALAWSRSSAYATVDKRVVRASALRTVVDAARAAEHARVDGLYDAMTEVLESAAGGDDVTAALRLVAIGEAAEAEENFRAAAGYYGVAARFSESLADRRVRVLALRRMARAHAALGEVERAVELFRQSLDHAVTADDIEAQIFVRIGLGNVMAFQGRWHDATEHFEAALHLCGADYPKLRGQLCNNLAVVHHERGELEECSSRLIQAQEFWAQLGTGDHSVWFNARGSLAMTRGEYDAADTAFRQAVESAGNAFDRAMTLDNLAELAIRRGNLSDAENFGRSAEELALSAGSPRALAEIYTRLGKIFRMRADLNGVTFFEKALELCRGGRYPLTEANAYLEYGIFRRTLGDIEEARTYIQRARQLCADIGAEQLERAAAEQLAQL